MDFDLDKFLPYRLSLISNIISQGISDTYQKPFNLSVHEWRVVAVLGRHPYSTATDIIGYTAMDKVTISRAVKRLIEKGLVERESKDIDRRCMLINLTDKGRAIHAQVVPRVTQYEQQLFDQLSVQERQQLDRLLSKLMGIAAELNESLPT